VQRHPSFRSVKMEPADRRGIANMFVRERCSRVIHLGAQARVQHSRKNLLGYIDGNVIGFANVLEDYCHHSVEHLVYAWTSSINGAYTQMPYSGRQNVNPPLAPPLANPADQGLFQRLQGALHASLPALEMGVVLPRAPWLT
jgi:UDP-glucuronate 4-epimerase